MRDLQVRGWLRSQHERLPVCLHADHGLLVGRLVQVSQRNVHVGQVLLVVQDLGLLGLLYTPD